MSSTNQLALTIFFIVILIMSVPFMPSIDMSASVQASTSEDECEDNEGNDICEEDSGDDKSNSNDDDKSNSNDDDKSNSNDDDKSNSNDDDKSNSNDDDKSNSNDDDKSNSNDDDKSIMDRMNASAPSTVSGYVEYTPSPRILSLHLLGGYR